MHEENEWKNAWRDLLCINKCSISCDKNKLLLYFQNNVVLKYSDMVKILHCLQAIFIVTDAV